jgi:mono/diheme cytochrome c family protein
MNRFRFLALAAFVVWCSVFVSLSARQGDAAAAPPGDQQARGKALYNDKCASCHMENLKGSTETPALTGDMFWTNWETYTANNLVKQVRTTMPEDNPGSLTRQQYVDIVAYVLKTNEVPFTGDLPMDTDALKKVTIKKKE